VTSSAICPASDSGGVSWRRGSRSTGRTLWLDDDLQPQLVRHVDDASDLRVGSRLTENPPNRGRFGLDPSRKSRLRHPLLLACLVQRSHQLVDGIDPGTMLPVGSLELRILHPAVEPTIKRCPSQSISPISLVSAALGVASMLHAPRGASRMRLAHNPLDNVQLDRKPERHLNRQLRTGVRRQSPCYLTRAKCETSGGRSKPEQSCLLSSDSGSRKSLSPGSPGQASGRSAIGGLHRRSGPGSPSASGMSARSRFFLMVHFPHAASSSGSPHETERSVDSDRSTF
jgi:hypothetical protein